MSAFALLVLAASVAACGSTRSPRPFDLPRAPRHAPPTGAHATVVEHEQRVFVVGAVKRPGAFRYDDAMTLTRAVTLAGGLIPTAYRRIEVTRSYGDTKRRASVSLDAIVDGAIPDVPLDPGDMIYVPERDL